MAFILVVDLEQKVLESWSPVTSDLKKIVVIVSGPRFIIKRNTTNKKHVFVI